MPGKTYKAAEVFIKTEGDLQWVAEEGDEYQ